MMRILLVVLSSDADTSDAKSVCGACGDCERVSTSCFAVRTHLAPDALFKVLRDAIGADCIYVGAMQEGYYGFLPSTVTQWLGTQNMPRHGSSESDGLH